MLPVCYCFRKGEEWKAAFTSYSSAKAILILELDIMDLLPAIEQGNKYVVFQDYFTKWSMVLQVEVEKCETVDKGSDSILWCSRSYRGTNYYQI